MPSMATNRIADASGSALCKEATICHRAVREVPAIANSVAMAVRVPQKGNDGRASEGALN